MEKVSKRTDTQTITAHIDSFVKTLIENNESTGLDLDIEKFMLDYVEDNPATDNLTTRVHQLMQAASSDYSTETEEVLRYFLGRGIGSTPAGDDHVIGLLGIHTLTGFLPPDFVKTVKRLTDPGKITTKAGHYYLYHAMQGKFLPSFARILNAVADKDREKLERYLKNVFPIGHTSGIDTTFGMLLGILIIKKR